jgi:hypothetical protein
MGMFGNVAEWTLDYYRYDMYNDSPVSNPLAIDGEQVSADGDYYYPPHYVVRGRNRYFYRTEYLDMPVDSIATVKRRHAHWHKHYARTQNENIGFRIVKDERDKVFSTNSGKVIYYYRYVKIDENTDVHLYPSNDSRIVSNIQEGNYVIARYLKADNNGRWLCIQSIDYDNANVKKMCDGRIIGWITLDDMDI